jgi:predicted DNA binding CopG/RHH family protein
MARSTTASSARGRRAVANAGRTPLPAGYQPPDSEIDFSDIPEITEEELRTARRVGRPAVDGITKQMIAIRIRPDILAALRKQAAKRKQPYQTYIHKILERAAKRA